MHLKPLKMERAQTDLCCYIIQVRLFAEVLCEEFYGFGNAVEIDVVLLFHNLVVSDTKLFYQSSGYNPILAQIREAAKCLSEAGSPQTIIAAVNGCYLSSYDYQNYLVTVTRRNVAGMIVSSGLVLLFSRVNNSSSSR